VTFLNAEIPEERKTSFGASELRLLLKIKTHLSLEFRLIVEHRRYVVIIKRLTPYISSYERPLA
jgi:hypothetical protein